MPRKRQTREKANQEDDASKITGPSSHEASTAQTFDEYQCSGNVEIDFPALCALLGMKDIPAVCIKCPSSCTTETEGGDTEDNQSQLNPAPLCSKPCLIVELENEDPHSAKRMKVSGWKVNEQILRTLQTMLPSVSQLLSLQFWQAGLTDPMVISLVNTISPCSSLKSVTLEGNALPDQSFHLLLSEDSVLTHLSLRNNRIGDEGARLIGSALSTTRSANKKLLLLNLAFNSIGDEGATHIAQGLRLNRTLICLSLANNQIGDSGAAQLSAILGEFALTHEEVTERRKLLLQRTQTSCHNADPDQSCEDQLSSVPSNNLQSISKSSSRKKEASKKDDKPTHNKEKLSKKSSDVKAIHSKGGKPADKERSAQEDKSNISLNEADLVEIVNPLLDPSVDRRDGQLFLQGNTTLASLNLAGNRITEKSLPRFLKLLEMQDEGGGLLRLCLQRNLFSPECEYYTEIKELLALTDPDIKNCSEQTEEEGQAA
ncbi:leucine-rich repeat-containing protein 71 [Odontesthes bonariensis]|uniref:leucine-rich repeat-containing protein 71 n=1 Tax=Odontesthes bonariensis TaxID=219752 RepID=UPI003F58D455